MTSRVNVSCRIRPSNTTVEDICLSQNGDNPNELLSQGLIFAFDQIFWPDCSQSEVFSSVVLPVINDALQTGSGKTHTMQGSRMKDERGVIFRTAETILKYSQDKLNEINTDFRASFLEVYQERLFDLLLPSESHGNGPMSSSSSSSSLKIREHHGGAVWVDGLSDIVIVSAKEFDEAFGTAMRRRATGSHAMNAESSRSHLCCIITLRQRKIASDETVSSKIHLVDLAGSEMVRKTDASGSRLQEAKYINKSLSALGNVINALTGNSTAPSNSTSLRVSSSSNFATSNAPNDARNNQQQQHIPYRDSKLTRLLQDSLGGNAKTVLILTVSPCRVHMPETLSTLRFGERARQLKTKPKINSVPNSAAALKALERAERQILALTATVQELQASLAAVDSKGSGEKELCAICGGKSDILPLPLSLSLPLSGEPCKDRIIPRIQDIKTNKNHNPVITAIKGNVSGRSSRRNSSVKVNPNDNDGGEVEVDEDSRCAVCGLSQEDSDELTLQTGEVLGTLFMCDGNCGCRFHVRCAGVTDQSCSDGGDIEGEWFCTTCAATTTTTSHPSSGLTDDDDDELAIGTGCINSSHEAALARVLADYHAMRRERNRVLQQWQHERRLAGIMEKTRRETDRQRDLELEAMKGRLETESHTLTDELTRLRVDNEHLQCMLAVATEQQNLISSIASGGVGDTTGLSSNKRSHIAVQTRDTLSLTTNSDKVLKAVKGLGPVDTARGGADKALVGGGDGGSGSGGGISIPRPWADGKRTTSQTKSARRNRGVQESADSSSQSPSQSQSSSPSQQRMSFSPIRSSSTIRRRDDQMSPREEATGTGSGTVKIRGGLPKLNHCLSPKSNQMKSLETNESEGVEGFPFDRDLVATDGVDDEDDDDGMHSVQDSSGNNNRVMDPRCRFLKPLKSRLRDLLKSVQEETGSYVEIRQRMRDRELERSQLKSRQYGADGHNSSSNATTSLKSLEFSRTSVL